MRFSSKKMNLVNIIKHLYQSAQKKYGLSNATTRDVEMLAAEQLLHLLKAFENSHFNELATYQSLYFDDENETSLEADETQDTEIRRSSTLEEMKKVVDWIDEHANYSSSPTLHRFSKTKSMHYIPEFRIYFFLKQNRNRESTTDQRIRAAWISCQKTNRERIYSRSWSTACRNPKSERISLEWL